MRLTKLKIKNLHTFAFFISLLVGCSFKFELTSQRTALENQIMGSYKELDDDLIVTKSEEKSSEKSLDKNLVTQSTYQRSIRNRAFNADDVKDFKDNGLLGESSDGILVLLPKEIRASSKSDPNQLRLAEVLIDEENKDRQILWNHEYSKSLPQTPESLNQIKEKFFKSLYEESPKGHWFNLGKKWSQK